MKVAPSAEAESADEAVDDSDEDPDALLVEEEDPGKAGLEKG